MLGIDGGGTKTEAVILDLNDQILGQGIAGPSNPLRVGIANAAAAIREAIERLAWLHIRRDDIMAAQIGLAGARRDEIRARMREALATSAFADVEIVGDADIALYGVTEARSGIVVIAGTGSICCGINARGKRSGPVVGDRLPVTKARAPGLPDEPCERSRTLPTAAARRPH